MKKIQLARYGGLSPVKQKHYTTDYEDMGYHGAPERYGIYAFLYPFIDWFLLGGDTGKMKSFNESKPFKNKRDQLTVTYKKFSVEGDIWIHIEPAPKHMHFIKEVRGSWNRIDASNFPVIFQKEYALMIGQYAEASTHNFGEERVNELSFTIKSPFKLFTTDYLEVFVPKTTKITNF